MSEIHDLARILLLLIGLLYLVAGYALLQAALYLIGYRSAVVVNLTVAGGGMLLLSIMLGLVVWYAGGIPSAQSVWTLLTGREGYDGP